MNEEEEAEYFDEVMDTHNDNNGDQQTDKMFSELSLSRPLLRAVEAMGYITPTPIQSAVIPLAMAGRDVCASAVTGSGKTAAFSLPFLERLLFRRKDVATIRVLVVSPTRELATQTYQVLQKLTQFTDITSALICGGKKDVKSQEATLRLRPDVVICTPGRLIDHLRNSRSVNIDDLDVLVLDEVDRLLDLGFQEEVEELVKHCPATRQTLLFSATMTPKVEDLVKLSLRKPIRVKTASSNTTVAPRLVQEFIKLREENERDAIMAALICRSFTHRVIAFFETKHETHRFYTILLLLGVKACELHGDVTQVQRYLALERFRKGEVDVMVATDVAARGLDIPGVQTVINSEMPRNASTYVHRVGRTARAGCGGRSVTLVSDSRRKVMKEVLKNYTGVGGEGADASESGAGAGGQVLSRTVPTAVVDHYMSTITSSEEDLQRIMREEKLNARMKVAEAEVERAENMLLYENEIAARPARTWYQTQTQKNEVKAASTKRAREEEQKLTEPEVNEDGVTVQMASVLKAQKMAKHDDYRMDEKKKEKEHRMSRKKRRRQEALKDVEESNGMSFLHHYHAHS
jgi:ATP-dependent RNA helicase DDX27